jgi:predicted SAM-dependent methyltransferase
MMRVRLGPIAPLYHWTRLRWAPRIVIGAASDRHPGWCSTDREVLDVTVRADFARYWKPSTRRSFLAEHVWEHLTPEDARAANRNCFEFLALGGRFRLAVPDGLHPDPGYRERVRPDGTGPGARDHKVLYDYRSLTSSLEEAGFRTALLEYWDEDGRFHAASWSAEDGPIERSARNDPRNTGDRLVYTSLIIDAFRE